MHPKKLEMDEAQDYPEAGWVELGETLKYGSEESTWRAHGVSRGVRDRYYKQTQPESGWFVHRWSAMHRPDWTAEEREAKAELYGSRDHPDFRRNILGLHGDAQSSMFVLARLMAVVDQEKSSFYNTTEYTYIRINDERLRDCGMPIEELLDFPPLHQAYGRVWAGMDVGMTNHPSEILIFGEDERTSRGGPNPNGVPNMRLKCLTRIHLERISAPDQRAVLAKVHDFYRPRAISMDKMQPVSEPVLTPDGWRPIGKLSEGDQVIGSAGVPVTVTGVYPQMDRRVMKVTCTDGSWTRCGPEHLWTVEDSQTGRRMTITTERLGAVLDSPKQRRWTIPMLSGPAFLRGEGLRLDPYLLGALLGNGNLRERGHGSLRFSTGHAEVATQVAACLPAGYRLKETSQYNYEICGPDATRRGADGRWTSTNVVIEALDDLGLLGRKSPEKWIPPQYLEAGAQDRLALLQGLMDTDGHVGLAPSRSIGMNTTSLAIAQGLVQLVESFGGSGRIRSHPARQPNWHDVHRVNLAIPADLMPFRLTAKVERVGHRTRPKRFVATVELLDEAEDSVCIRVDSDDHLYVTRHHLLTHNTGLGLPIYQEIIGGDVPGLARCLRGYNFSEKIPVAYEATEDGDWDDDNPAGKPVLANVLEYSSDMLRLLVDQQQLLLPWDVDMLREFQGQTYVVSKSSTDAYGKRFYNKGKFHALDAARMAVLGYQQEKVEMMRQVVFDEPVFDSFLV